MNFDLVRPCPKCPFRTDVTPYIRAARVREIQTALVARQQTFACHQTVEHDGNGEHVPRDVEQHCAGALILLEKLERPNQMMRIAERLGRYDAARLDMAAPVYEDFGEMLSAHRRGAR